MSTFRRLLLLACPLLALSFRPTTPFIARTSLLRYHTDDGDVSPSKTTPPSLKKSTEMSLFPASFERVPTVPTLHDFDELSRFLEEDEDRLTAIKFYAPWCKTCQRLGIHFGRLARDWGDGVQNRRAFSGRIRCVAVEYRTKDASRWITEDLQIPAIPTLQLYTGHAKVWQGVGAKDTRKLQQELRRLEGMSPEEMRRHGEEVDDGVLAQAVEDHMFLAPDFLNEEW